MIALFALGVMSLTWMLAIAGLIAIEKLLPRKQLANHLVAITLVMLALGVSLVPRHVPGLTLPDSSQAKAAMHTMPEGSRRSAADPWSGATTSTSRHG